MNDEKTKPESIKRDTKELETWRESKKLVSLLGDSEDLKRRKQLAAAASGGLKICGRGDALQVYRSVLEYITRVLNRYCYTIPAHGRSPTKRPTIWRLSNANNLDIFSAYIIQRRSATTKSTTELVQLSFVEKYSNQDGSFLDTFLE